VKKNWQTILLLLLPAAIVLLLYLPAIRYDFVWDDTIFLRDLPLYRMTGSWSAALTRPFILSPNYYRPLPLLTFLAELQLGGLNPSLFHLTNLLIHAINTTLVTALAFSLLRTGRDDSSSYKWALTAGLLYGLHPALIEGAVFISSRFDLLLTMFLLLALLADVKLTGKARPVLVGLAFFLAALSKEMAIAFVLILPLWHLARRPQLERPISLKGMVQSAWRQGDVAVYLAVILAGLVYLGVRVGVLGYLLLNEPSRALPVGTPLQHLLLTGRTLVEYLKLIVWPFTSLTPLHYSQLPLPTASLAGWTAWAAMGLVLAGLIYAWQRRPRFALLALAALLALLPVSNILPLELGGGAFVAERFVLFPLALAVLALATLSVDLSRDISPKVAAACILWLIVSVGTIQLITPNWRDNVMLWQWAAERAPRSAMPFTNLALEYNNRGDYQAGLAVAEEALARDEKDSNAWNNAGLAFFGLNRFEDAENAFSQAIERQPQDALYWNNLAGALREQGKLVEAERIMLDQALRLAPELPAAHLNLGIIYLRADRPDLAAKALQTAIRLLPPEMSSEAEALLSQSAEPERWLRLGDLLLGNKAWEQALAAFDQAGALGARPVDALVGISTVLIAQEEWDKAEALLQQTLDDYGGDARLYYNLGLVARQRGELDTARTLFTQAALLAPDWEQPQQELK
jgi:protein O-mannosyl-transferase